MAPGALGTGEREILHQDAMVNWRRTQEIVRDAQMMLPRCDQITASSVILLEECEARRVITANVDRAIRHWTEDIQGADDLDRPVAVVASADLGELLRILPLTQGRFRAIGADDVGTTLGLAIVAQPAIAIVDAELGLGSGVDAGMTLSIYAPATRVMVLTDDPGRAADLSIVGLGTEHRDVSDSTLLNWIEDRAA